MIARATVIHDTKKVLGAQPTLHVDVPDFLFQATDNARCGSAEIFVKEGDHVYMGQLIGMRDGRFFKQPIHASCSGTVGDYEEHYHRSGKKVKFLKIINDHKDEWDPSIQDRSDEEIAALTREDFANILEANAMVGLGGSSFPTHVKFKTDKKIDHILINAVECEPYINADIRLMNEEMEKVITGCTYLQQAFSCKKVLICIKKKHTQLISVYRTYLKRFEGCGIEVCPVGNFYPQGWEVTMIKSALGIDIPSGHLPSEFGIVNFNVSTVWGIYEAIKHNRPVVERRISITGDGVRFPSNFIVRLGTPLPLLLEKCGGFTHPEKDKVFILGGPMMGASLPSEDCIISKTVTSVLVFDREEVPEAPCIRCGSCVYSCPTGLEPKQIMDAVKAFDKERMKALNPLRCIECGLCTYVCTSHIKVTDFVRRAKMFVKPR